MSNLVTPLSGALQDLTTPEAQAEIVHLFWPDGASAPSQSGSLDWNTYFAYYTRECNAALVNEGKYLAARTHQDLLRIAHLLKDEMIEDEVKQKIRQTLTQQRPPDDENKMLDGSIKLATRLFVMINIGPLPSEVCGGLFLPWTRGSLRDAVHDYFNTPPEIVPVSEHDAIGIDLTARNIDRISGIEVVPTDNLVDHLRLVEMGKKLCIFHHVSFLKRMKAIQTPMFPPGFIDETLDTLCLLFPDKDNKTKEWLESESRTKPLWAQMDSGLVKCGHFRPGHPSRRLKHYKFWRDRLGTLEEAADEAMPPSKALLKALKDNKRGDRWLNSWVAIVVIGLTLFFGLVQSIEGAMQVYKAYHPAAS